MSLNRPRVSFVIASRNDQWCGDSVGRLQNTLHHLIEHFEGEVVIVDWGSEKPLSSLNKAWKEVSYRPKVRLLYVPPSITSVFGSHLCETVALNAGIRRSHGQYIARLDQDILSGLRFRSWLRELPDSGIAPACFSERRELPSDVTFNPHFSYPKKYPRWSNPPWADDDEWFFRSAVGMLLARGEDWQAIRGYNEVLRYRDHMEHDLCIRFKRTCGLVNLGPIVDYDFYHQFHERPKGVPTNPMPSLDELNAVSLDVNDETWGLGQYQLEERCL